ncbi:fimbrillin family protein [Alistipes sp.]|uniref:fimbrillin family protein n=1 Tax=Alistipes sp. TaxID=1872444 RepID=UPI003AF0A7B1
MKRILTITMLAAMIATACTKEEGGDVTGPRNIVIDPTVLEMSKTTASVHTRATDVDFETGDAIGLTITMADGSKHADNARFTYGSGKFTSDDNLIWYEDIGLKSNLLAYHPYADAVPTEFTVKADQSGSNYTLSDLMIAAKQDVTPTVDATNMTFYHQLTKLVINVNNQSGGQITAVTVQGTVPTATVDVAAKRVEVKAGAAAADIKANTKTANAQYYAIVVPQTVAPKLAVTVNVGGQEKTLTQTYQKLDMKPGQYSVAIQVTADKIDVTMTGDIEDWTDNGSLTPDDGAPAFEEFDDYFMYDNERYALVTMKDGRKWMAENLRYLPEGVNVSTDPTDNDAAIWAPYSSDGTTCTPLTDPAEVAKKGYLYSFDTALGGVITPENSASFEGAQGICPKGWHIPTHAEWIALVGKTNKNAAGEDLTDTSAPYYDAGYQAGKITLVDADGFNFTRAGVRMRSTIAGAGSYSKNIYPSPGGELSVNYLLSSTLYKNAYSTTDPTQLTNIQFFALMSTIVANTPEGKLSAGYLGYKSGVSVRCIKDAAN